MIPTITELASLRERVLGWNQAGLRVGFVPTMGNLHAGHQSLVRLAREHADRVVASVFVNPTQFGPGEDYERYPRTVDADLSALEEAGADAMWLPSVETMYPYGMGGVVEIRVPGVTGVLEGAHRPGHFDGVTTVVARLFNQVQADVAVFGRKDYQQLAVIRYMVRELAFPVELMAAPIVREADGLAMSSRNQYLSPPDRQTATAIHRALQAAREAAGAGTPLRTVEQDAAARLTAAGFAVDYVAIRHRDLSTADSHAAGPLVALAAARLGSTRLIDNIEFER
ncbi:pantoate--beta-alanine ligase [Lysobacter sp. H23M47]|uniref:pantoate--beta-alanine ligase n=1 Tax=Lysobacter sp. H23M47 TaxID=2781024 RepID=UPI00187EAB91|nr:pantoate--beta-alanine ligase [Lysobacter sp. H23M47]QOW23746.1 pantoate--beta-alanine ligase [Lysobacter sp. H23M47]